MTKLIYPELTYQVRGAFFEVFNELHHLDLSEAGWEQALMIALKERDIEAESQVEYALGYKGKRVGRFFVDILVENKLILELKATEKLHPLDEAQLINYLKVSELKLGILVNFGGDKLEIKRILNTFTAQTNPQPAPMVQGTPSTQLLYPDLTKELRTALFEVHNHLGPGFMHMHYRRAVRIELRSRDIPSVVQKEIVIHYRRQPIETRETRLIIVDEKLLLAPIAVRQITPRLKGRIRQYLKILRLNLGLIANFHARRLEIEYVRV